MSPIPEEIDQLAAALAARLHPRPPTESEAVEAIGRKLAAMPAVDHNGIPLNQNGDPR